MDRKSGSRFGTNVCTILATFPPVLALAALLLWGGREVERPWGVHEGAGPAWSSTVVEGWVDAMVAEQVVALGGPTKVRPSP